jgi:cell division protein FtsI/penicillin-binding protein 2
MRDIPRDVAVKIEANKQILSGVTVESRIKRVYLLNENASHVFGYTGLAAKKDLEREKFDFDTLSLSDLEQLRQQLNSQGLITETLSANSEGSSIRGRLRISESS